MNGPDTLHHREHTVMQRIPLVCLLALVISGCSEGEPPAPESSTAPAAVSEPGLPMIAEELLEGSVAMDLMAVTRRLDEITGSYATKKAIQPTESEGMQQDLERLQKAKPLESETVLYDECLALLKDVQTWATASQEVNVQPARKRIKALKAALRINPSDRHNEPLMQAIMNTDSIVIEPNKRGAAQTLDEADKLAAKPNTDEAAAKLTREYMAKVRELVTMPNKDLQTEVMRLANKVTWELKLDSYRKVQLWKTNRDAAQELLPFRGRGGLQR